MKLKCQINYFHKSYGYNYVLATTIIAKIIVRKIRIQINKIKIQRPKILLV